MPHCRWWSAGCGRTFWVWGAKAAAGRGLCVGRLDTSDSCAGLSFSQAPDFCSVSLTVGPALWLLPFSPWSLCRVDTGSARNTAPVLPNSLRRPFSRPFSPPCFPPSLRPPPPALLPPCPSGEARSRLRPFPLCREPGAAAALQSCP